METEIQLARDFSKQIAALEAKNTRLLEALKRIGYDENVSYLACPGPPNCDRSHYDSCPVGVARAALEHADGQ